MVTAGVPSRMPLATIGGLVSNGIAFLFTVMRGAAERRFGHLAGDALGEDVDQHQVVVGAAADHAEAAGDQPLGQRAGVGHDLPLVVDEGRIGRLLEAHRLGGDHVHQRSALHAREDRPVDRLGVDVAAQDQAAARPAQRLVGGGGDEVGVRHRVGVQPGRHQPGDVRHVDHQQRADLVGDGAEAGRSRSCADRRWRRR